MKRLKPYLVWIVVIIYIFLPVLFWVRMVPLDTRFTDPVMILTSLGQIAALLGMTIFSLNLILASRLKIVETIFDGINILYRDHHNLGGIAFVLLLFHPLFLASKYLYTSTYSAATFLIPSLDNLPVAYGIIALLFMMLSLIATYYFHLKYQYWKLLHKFLALAYLIGFIHLIRNTSDVSRNMTLRYYMISISIIALILITIRVFSKILAPKKIYYLIKIQKFNNDVFHLILRPLGKKMNFHPGQFVYISFNQPGFSSEQHPFSIISDPKSENLELGIKMSGDHTADFTKLKAGANALVEGPFGRFSPYFNDNKQQIWIAGGVGITPFLSMVKNLNDYGISTTLFWSLKNEKEAFLISELQKIANSNSNFKFIPFYTDKSGFITADYISKNTPTDNKDIYICGPGKMMKALRSQFKNYNVDNIYSEEFDL